MRPATDHELLWAITLQGCGYLVGLGCAYLSGLWLSRSGYLAGQHAAALRRSLEGLWFQLLAGLLVGRPRNVKLLFTGFPAMVRFRCSVLVASSYLLSKAGGF